MEKFKKDLVAKLMLTNTAGILILSSYKFADAKIGGLSGFTEAICFAVCVIWTVVMICQSFHMYMLHIDEKKLEAAYIKSKDERNIMIREKTSGGSFTATVFIICIMIMVFAYISVMVTLVLAGLLAAMFLVRLILKLYYEKKY